MKKRGGPTVYNRQYMLMRVCSEVPHLGVNCSPSIFFSSSHKTRRRGGGWCGDEDREIPCWVVAVLTYIVSNKGIKEFRPTSLVSAEGPRFRLFLLSH